MHEATRTGHDGGIAALCADFARDQSGATAIEYALMAAGIALTILTTIFNLGDTVLNQLYMRIAEAFNV